MSKLRKILNMVAGPEPEDTSLDFHSKASRVSYLPVANRQHASGRSGFAVLDEKRLMSLPKARFCYGGDDACCGIKTYPGRPWLLLKRIASFYV